MCGEVGIHTPWALSDFTACLCSFHDGSGPLSPLLHSIMPGSQQRLRTQQFLFFLPSLLVVLQHFVYGADVHFSHC